MDWNLIHTPISSYNIHTITVKSELFIQYGYDFAGSLDPAQ